MSNLYVLENQKIKIALDKQARLVELSNLETKHNYASKGFLWRLIFQKDDFLENEIFAEDCTPAISSTDKEIIISYNSLNTFDIKLEITISLLNDDVNWDIELQNNEKDLIVSECHFPLLKRAILKMTRLYCGLYTVDRSFLTRAGKSLNIKLCTWQKTTRASK